MPYAIIRGKNGHRHEVDFGDTSLRVKIHSSEKIIELFIEADSETVTEGRRRFAILNIPRHRFSEATGAAATRANKSHTVAARVIYGTLPHSPGVLPSSYGIETLPGVDQQLEKAGVRLAATLNAVLSR